MFNVRSIAVAPQQRNLHRVTSLATGLAILVISATTLVTLVGPRHRLALDSRSGIRVTSMPESHAAGQATPTGSAPQRSSVDTGSIVNRLQTTLSPLQGSYGVAVIDVSTGAAYGVNPDTSFRAASVNKLPILIELYRRAEDGKLDLDQTLTIADEDVQHYGTGIIQDPDADKTYSLRDLAALMIETSDNTAAFVLERRLGRESIQSSIDRWGLKQTSMAANTTTPADMAFLLSRLYTMQLLSPKGTATVLAILQHTYFTDRIQSGVPSDVSVAHKVGSDVGVFNDAGLVLLPGRAYALAVLSQNADESQAETAIAGLSRDIYAFESSLNSAPSR